jgi:hypothetical protein
MGIDFAALGTGMDIRQALDVLVGGPDAPPEVQAAARAVEERVEELETRLSTARRTAWVAVPIAWSEVMPGDTIVAKDGTLLAVTDTETDQGEHWIRYVAGSSSLLIKSRDPDRPVPVLRRPTADALDILTRQLGAQAM